MKLQYICYLIIAGSCIFSSGCITSKLKNYAQQNSQKHQDLIAEEAFLYEYAFFEDILVKVTTSEGKPQWHLVSLQDPLHPTLLYSDSLPAEVLQEAKKLAIISQKQLQFPIDRKIAMIVIENKAYVFWEHKHHKNLSYNLADAQKLPKGDYVGLELPSIQEPITPGWFYWVTPFTFIADVATFPLQILARL